jgi:L-amino acid N-acyltransferase YncA
MDKELAVREIQNTDAGSVCGIYNYYIENTVITFEEAVVTADEMLRRIRAVRSSSLPWFVAERGKEILGYAYAGRWKERSAYRFAVEATVYVRQELGKSGIGSRLYARLLPELSRLGYHTTVGIIALPNTASVALHEKFGFVQAGLLREAGFKFDRWIDVGYWQRLL